MARTPRPGAPGPVRGGWTGPRVKCQGDEVKSGSEDYLRFGIRLKDILPLLHCDGRPVPFDDKALLEGLDIDCRSDAAIISLADWFRLWRRLVELSSEETVALSRRPLMIGTADLVVGHARQCGNLADALRRIAEACNVMHGGVYNIVENRHGMLSYTIRDEGFPYTRPHDGVVDFVLECTLIVLHATMSELAQQDLSPFLRKVGTRRAVRHGVGMAALTFWRVPVCLGDDTYSLSYDPVIAKLPVMPMRQATSPRIAIHNRIVSMAEAGAAGMDGGQTGHGFTIAVGQVLDGGIFDQREAARRLGVSVATLRRRLQEEGTGFRRLRARSMCNYAKAHLVRSVEVAEVADDLGFSDPRAFTRAFKTWTGHTPNEWRCRMSMSPSE